MERSTSRRKKWKKSVGEGKKVRGKDVSRREKYKEY